MNQKAGFSPIGRIDIRGRYIYVYFTSAVVWVGVGVSGVLLYDGVLSIGVEHYEIGHCRVQTIVHSLAASISVVVSINGVTEIHGIVENLFIVK